MRFWTQKEQRRFAKAAREQGLDCRHEISLLFCGAQAVRELNRRWRGKNRATDVLSFPIQELKPGEAPEKGALGDIVVCPAVARRQAEEMGLEFGEHLAHLLIHGLLHLLGYDHHRASDARKMERQERILLDQSRDSC